MQGLHTRPIEVSKGVGTGTRLGWTLVLLFTLCFTNSFASDKQASTTSTEAVCGPAVIVNGGEPVRLNEPSLLPQLTWLELPSVPTLDQLLTQAPFNSNANVMIPVTTVEMTPANMLMMYRLGFKLYQFHNVHTDQPQVHQYQHNKSRGILTFDNFARAMTENLTVRGYRDDRAKKAGEVTEHLLPGGNTLKGFKQAMFPHKIPRNFPQDGLPKNHPGEMDMSRPAFEIRFNSDVAALLKKCGEAERRDIDAVSKQARVDEHGHTAMTTSTWFTPEVQSVVAALVESGDAYTIGVYTTKDHPYVLETNEAPGKLVGGIASIHVDGVSTGLTLFLDRTRYQKPDGTPGNFVYNNAGKLAFLAEVFHTFQSGSYFLDTVTVNEAAKITGSVLVPREEYLLHVKAAHANPKRPVIPTGPYELPFDEFEKSRFYEHLGIEAPRQNVSKKVSNKAAKAAREANTGETSEQPPQAE